MNEKQHGGVVGPSGFHTHVGNIGIKDTHDDFTLVWSDVPCRVAGLFTQNRFEGPSVTISRQRASAGTARAIVTIARNANVATGPTGVENAFELTRLVAAKIGCSEEEVLVGSTGRIGWPYPMDRIRSYLDRADFPPGGEPPEGEVPEGEVPGGGPARAARTGAGFERVAEGMMTTDTRPKCRAVPCGPGTVVGVAKGVGMIEPDMATLLVYVFTDVDLEAGADLDPVFRRVVDRTFNCLSVDTDTSTSDMALLFANGVAGRVAPAVLEAALDEVCLGLVRDVASDGEGATKLLEVRVTGAADATQAKRVAKAVVNSPLVKTAVHGCDPNWGRVVMAVGKSVDDAVALEDLRLGFNGHEVRPTDPPGEDALAEIAESLRADEVVLTVDLGLGGSAATVWGCDLSAQYVHINADYTT